MVTGPDDRAGKAEDADGPRARRPGRDVTRIAFEGKATGGPSRVSFRILTTADTEVQTLAAAVRQRPEGSVEIRAGNPNAIGDLERFVSEELEGCTLLIVRVLGGKSYFREGFERLAGACRDRSIAFMALPGEQSLDPELAALCSVPLRVATQTLEYFSEGGVANYANMLKFLGNQLFATSEEFEPPAPLPREGLYQIRLPSPIRRSPQIGILFYRAHWMSGNLAPIDALIRSIEGKGGTPVPVFCYSLKGEVDGIPLAFRKYFLDEHGAARIDVLISTLSFTAATLSEGAVTEASGAVVDLFDKLNVPVLQAVLCTSSEAEWRESTAGLTPRDTAMNVVLPEFDGRIGTVAISFKEEGRFDEKLGMAIKEYVPEARPDRSRGPACDELRQVAAHAQFRETHRHPLRQLSHEKRPDRQRRGARHARVGHECPARPEGRRVHASRTSRRTATR